MALYPIIVIKDFSFADDLVLLNHEQIHFRQQLECLIIPFYVFYIINYLFNLMIYFNHHKAYSNILFEKESFKNENDFFYLQKRKHYAWLK